MRVEKGAHIDDLARRLIEPARERCAQLARRIREAVQHPNEKRPRNDEHGRGLFRADVTGQYRGKSDFHGSDVFVFSNAGVPTAGADTYTASKSEWLVLANAYVDLGTWWYVTPFIGAGVGFSRNTISSYVDTNTPAGGVAIAPAASKWNLAWALHTGLAYRVNPGFTVELGYSYVNLGDATTGIVSDFTGFANNHTMGFKDITSHDLTLGVRWNLDSPTVYAPPPPPVVRKG